ncbi:hypothetical protein LTR10_012713 [Elasticomyces elasticus]|nr:hypothetical protein LTR10_012713 [Elasticomyces elasticus]KAK5034591.1 hypothetical protein LTR13_006246 [Exophiala sideris]
MSGYGGQSGYSGGGYGGGGYGNGDYDDQGYSNSDDNNAQFNAEDFEQELQEFNSDYDNFDHDQVNNFLAFLEYLSNDKSIDTTHNQALTEGMHYLQEALYNEGHGGHDFYKTEVTSCIRQLVQTGHCEHILAFLNQLVEEERYSTPIRVRKMGSTAKDMVAKVAMVDKAMDNTVKATGNIAKATTTMAKAMMTVLEGMAGKATMMVRVAMAGKGMDSRAMALAMAVRRDIETEVSVDRQLDFFNTLTLSLLPPLTEP